MEMFNTATLMLCLLCFNLLPFFTHGEWFSSIAKLETLAGYQESLYESLQKHMNMEYWRIRAVRKLIQDRRRHVAAHGKNGRKLQVKSVFDSYLLLNRFKQGWGKIEGIFSDRPILQELNETIKNISASFPHKSEYNGARDALLRLYKIYNLQPSAFAQGHLSRTNVSLSALDTYMIGKRALDKEDFHTSKDWIEESLRIMGDRNATQDLGLEVKRVTMLENLAYSDFKLGNWRQCSDMYENILKIYPQYENRDRVETKIKEMDDISNFKPRHRKKNPDPYDGLCDGQETLYNTNHVTNLTCYLSNKHPLLMFRPLGVEVVSVSPPVMLFHNALSDKEVDDLINVAEPLLQRALVEHKYTGELIETSYRISQTAWISRQNKLMHYFDRRIEAMTGLDTTTAEELQVNNYGMGGFYEPHYDHSTISFGQDSIFDSRTGNRIATLMFYLSDVEAGGGTVFPEVELRVLPEKGSAVFWYNLHRSGDGDWRTYHAGCPVLLGNKWVANKWFHERGQEFRRPCGKHEYAV